MRSEQGFLQVVVVAVVAIAVTIGVLAFVLKDYIGKDSGTTASLQSDTRSKPQSTKAEPAEAEPTGVLAVPNSTEGDDDDHWEEVKSPASVMPRTRPGLWEGTTEIDTSATHQALKDGKNKNPGLYNQVVAESAKEGIKLDADASTWLSSNPDDKKIEFTDSAATGRHCITDTSPQSYEQCPGCSTRTFRSLSSGNRFKITVACSGGFSTEMGLTFHSETDYTVVAVVNSPMGSVRIPQRYRWLSHTCGNVSVGKPSCPDGTSPQRR